MTLTATAQTAVSLPGATDEVQATYDFDVTNGFTIEYKIYMHSLQNFNAGVTKGITNLAGPLDTYFNSSGNLTVFVGDGVATTQINIPGFSAGQWYHIAITAAPGGAAEVFVDGVSAGTWVHPGLANSVNPLLIGDRDDNATNSNADYDNIRIWSGIRTAEQINNNKDFCLIGSEPGLELLYQCETGSGTTVFDLAIGDGAQDGTILNGGTWDAGVSCMPFPCVLNDYALLQADYNELCADDTIVEMSSSDLGNSYYLTDATNGGVVGSSKFGTGSSLSWNTGLVTETTTFEVVAKGPSADYGIDLPLADDYVRFDNPFTSYTNAITVEAWVNNSGGVFPWAGQATVGSDNMSTNVWLWHDFGAGQDWQVNNGGTWNVLDFPVMPAGWIHVATVADTTGMYIYYDGVLVASNTLGLTSGMIDNPASIIDLGQDPRYAPGTSFRNSDLGYDDFRVWNVARSENQIAENMNCLSGVETGLVHYTTFDEAIGVNLSSEVGPNGEIFNNPSPWIVGSGSCGSCSLTMSDNFTLTIDPIAEQTISQVDFDACVSADTLITLLATEAGVSYYLRDDADDSILDGPIMGTGSSIDLDAPAISTTTTYNVFAEYGDDSAIDFDGVDDYVSTSNSTDLAFAATSLITIESWVKLNPGATNYPSVICKYEPNSTFKGWGLQFNNSGEPEMYLIENNVGNYIYETASIDLRDGTWHHVAVTYDGSASPTGIVFYIDGNPITQSTNAAGAITDLSNSGEILIGGGVDSGTPDYFMDGALDEIRVWSAVRTQSEIQASMHSCLEGTESNLAVYYPIKNGNGTIVSDAATNGIDGTMTNMDANTDWIENSICGSCSTELTDMLTITINALPTVDAGVDTTLCENASYTLSGAGADTYLWDNSVTDGVAFNVGAAGATTYTVTGTDANGCENTDMVELTVVVGPTITAVITDELAGSDGEIDLTVTGGSGSFDYSWSNGPTTEDITGLAGGNYTVTVDDGNCALDSTFTVGSSVGFQENTIVFNLYPNPTNGEVSIDFTDVMSGSILNITDASGKLVYTTSVSESTIKIDLSTYENGVYLLNLSTQEGNFFERIVKQ